MKTLTLLLCILISSPAQILRVGYKASSSPAITATELCFAQEGSSPCTITSSVSVGQMIIVCALSEGPAMATPTDSGSNTYTQDYDYNSLVVLLRTTCWHSVATTGLTSGTSTITFDGNFASGNNGYAIKMLNLASNALDKSAQADVPVASTTFSSGATAPLTANGGCLGIPVWENAANISSAGAGFSILKANVGLDDNRDSGYEFGAFSSGSAVTANATMNTAVVGDMSVLCYK